MSYEVVEAGNGKEFVLKRNKFGASDQTVAYNNWFNTILVMVFPFPVLIVLNALIYYKVILKYFELKVYSLSWYRHNDMML
jgi:hypothetical protein